MLQKCNIGWKPFKQKKENVKCWKLNDLKEKRKYNIIYGFSPIQSKKVELV